MNYAVLARVRIVYTRLHTPTQQTTVRRRRQRRRVCDYDRSAAKTCVVWPRGRRLVAAAAAATTAAAAPSRERRPERRSGDLLRRADECANGGGGDGDTMTIKTPANENNMTGGWGGGRVGKKSKTCARWYVYTYIFDSTSSPTPVTIRACILDARKTCRSAGQGRTLGDLYSFWRRKTRFFERNQFYFSTGSSLPLQNIWYDVFWDHSFHQKNNHLRLLEAVNTANKAGVFKISFVWLRQRACELTRCLGETGLFSFSEWFFTWFY